MVEDDVLPNECNPCLMLRVTFKLMKGMCWLAGLHSRFPFRRVRELRNQNVFGLLPALPCTRWVGAEEEERGGTSVLHAAVG